MNDNRAFTLIELLVTIAIIGTLTTVIMPSLTTVRSKSKDTAVKLQLENLKTEANLFYDTYGTYVGMFGSGQKPRTLLDAAITFGNTASTTASSSSATKWVVAVPLQGGGYYCTDSNAISTTTSWTVLPVSINTNLCQ